MLTLKINGLKELQAGVDDLIKSRLPKMMAMALTEAAKGVQAEVVKDMNKVFDRPTRWTLNSLYVKPATQSDQSASVWFEDDIAAGNGTPPAKYILPEVKGGPRYLKRFESALRKAGVLPEGMYAVPGEAAKIDAYGNMDRGQIIQILSYFKAFPAVGYRMNITQKKKASLAKGSRRTGQRGFTYFVGKPGSDGVPRRGKDFKPASNLPLGIWQRVHFGPLGSAVKPVIIFVTRPPRYRVRLPFFDIAQEYLDKEFPNIFNRLAKEMYAYKIFNGAKR